MKSLPKVIAMCGLAASLTLSACSSNNENSSGATELMLAVETSAGDPLADMLLAFADEVQNELGDSVSLTVQTGGAIGDEEAVLQGLRAGAIDVAAVSGSVANLDPTFSIMDMPFVFTDRDKVVEFLDGPYGDELSDSLVESVGARVLGFGENGFRHITNNKRPIVTSEDLAGLKIRVPGNPARVALFEALGAAPTQIDIGEAYLALDQGVLDGQENPLKVIDAFSFYEKQRYLSLTSHIYSPVYLTINEDTWQGLSPEIQQGLEKAAAAAAETSRNSGAEADQQLLAKFEAAGVEVNDADVTQLSEAVVEVREQIAGQIPGDFADRVLAEYRQ
ncbi:TRAP transporter substrate-binding protein [Mycolicibacterium vaccae]|uniref:TRAP dicarboxylate transporter, DctP subunit n=1 Tax=Mycolicibacterium vaccae ATCC 25954 TaxID=1194972 RepID=K0UTF3_MYCVA|nr:TRAP transporter substrate-binding protein [Mycolicibacterium vaccae]ANI40083.1 TRAP dicarboxylate transporter, DctP subunit [Mycolicibacterium vaccae 95051]EJZ05878.1 TRAP dicarboxylate transporter, DctP subunit [Mycolicibacterium vaccae ATCC 25954]MCV7061515.1 TRAP transporter substrate-binding protein [Mycolicibacterium vaccae]